MGKLELDLQSMVKNVFLSGGEDVCRVCWSVPEQGQLYLAEKVELKVPYCVGAVRLADILTTVTQATLEEDSALPESVCLACASAAIDAYLFLEFCRHAAGKLRQLRASLHTACDQLARPNRGGSALFLFLDYTDTAVVMDSSRKPPGLGEWSLARVLQRSRVLHARKRRRAQSHEQRVVSVARQRSSDETFASAAADLAECSATHTHAAPAADLHCQYCGKRCSSASVLRMHVVRLHTEKRYACPDPSCSKSFSSLPLLTAHRKEMHTFLECQHCGITYSRHSMRKHELTHGPRLKCEKCGGLFKCGDSVRAHRARCGLQQPRLCCHLCPNTYSSHNTLQQHFKFAHGDNPHACHICGKKYVDKSKLRVHVAAHSGEKLFRCRVCDASFKQANTLTYHMRARHTGDRPFKCEHCPQTFITSYHRVEHLRRHHGAPAPTCDVCGARFATRTRLLRHMRKHTQKL